MTRSDAMARHLTRYFTGKPCKHGHISERHTSSRGCYACLLNDSRHLFNSQKTRALERGIAWELTFDQWTQIWGDKIRDRGRHGNQLCMARFGDAGPYAIGNVKIITNLENIAERNYSEEQRQAASVKTRMQFSNSEQREKVANTVRAQWANPAYYAKMVAIHRDPKRRAATSARVKQQMADPERRKKASDAVKHRMADPVERQKQADRVRAYWARYREAKALAAR